MTVNHSPQESPDEAADTSGTAMAADLMPLLESPDTTEAAKSEGTLSLQAKESPDEAADTRGTAMAADLMLLLESPDTTEAAKSAGTLPLQVKVSRHEPQVTADHSPQESPNEAADTSGTVMSAVGYGACTGISTVVKAEQLHYEGAKYL